MVDADWKRLHPGSIAVNLIPRTWLALRGLWPLLLAAVLGRRTTPNHLMDAVIIGMLLVSTVGNTVFHWATLRYRVHDGRLEIQSGLISRQMRSIDVSRVQNVEIVRNVFQRMAGLAEVRVETASGREVEGQLSALSTAEAQALVESLGGSRAAVAGVDTSETVVQNDLTDLLKYGATGTRFAQAAIGLSLALEAVQWVTADVRIVPPRAFIALLPLAGLGAWLAGTVGAVVAYQGYVLLRRSDGRLAVDGGLFTRRRVEWRTNKVQAVMIDEPWLRRLAGLASVRVETAAVTRGEGGTATAEALVPAVASERIAFVVNAVSALSADPETTVWKPAHPLAILRAIVFAAIRGLVLTSLATWFLWPWGALVGLVIPLFLALAWADSRALAWALTDEALLVRGGYFRRETSIIPRAKVQSATILQPLWWRRRRVARLAVSAAGVQIAVPPMDEDDANALLTALVPR